MFRIVEREIIEKEVSTLKRVWGSIIGKITKRKLHL